MKQVQLVDAILSKLLELNNSSEIAAILSENDHEIIHKISAIAENPQAQRGLRVKAIQTLITAAGDDDSIWLLLANRDALTTWVYIDLQKDDEDLLLLSLKFLTGFCSHRLPLEYKVKLGFNLLAHLIEITLERERHEDHRSTIIARQALHTFLAVNWQFNSDDFEENKVLDYLLDHDEAGVLGQMFIKIVNRTDDDLELKQALHLLKNIFNNKAMAYSFFYPTDLKVLLEIIIRNLTDAPEESVDEIRRTYLQILFGMLTRSPLRQQPHIASQVSEILKVLANNTDPEVVGRARRLVEVISDFDHYQF